LTAIGALQHGGYQHDNSKNIRGESMKPTLVLTSS
jgi:hypothetical protein